MILCRIVATFYFCLVNDFVFAWSLILLFTWCILFGVATSRFVLFVLLLYCLFVYLFLFRKRVQGVWL